MAGIAFHFIFHFYFQFFRHGSPSVKEKLFYTGAMHLNTLKT